jgi:hypothetical protein
MQPQRTCFAGRVVRYGDAPFLMLQAISKRFSITCALIMFLGMAFVILSAFFCIHAFNVTSGLTSGDRNRVAELRRAVLAEQVCHSFFLTFLKHSRGSVDTNVNV